MVGVAGDVNEDDDVASGIAAAQSVGTLSIVVNVAGGGTGVCTDGRGVTASPTTTGLHRHHGDERFGTFNVTRLAAAAISEQEPDEAGQRGVV